MFFPVLPLFLPHYPFLIQPLKLSGHISLSSFLGPSLIVLVLLSFFFPPSLFCPYSQVAACSFLFSNYSYLTIQHLTAPTRNTEIDTPSLLCALVVRSLGMQPPQLH